MRSKNTNQPKVGKIIPNGVKLMPHEYNTILALTNAGCIVELIPPSQTPRSKTPDLLMLGMFWEIKSPIGNSVRTLEHIVKKATHQASNIIIDLRRLKTMDQESSEALQKLFTKFRSIKNLWVITHDNRIIKYKK